MIKAFHNDQHFTVMKEMQLIDELYDMIVDFNLKTRGGINQRLKDSIFDKYTDKIKQEAKIRYYKKNNI